MSNTINNWVYCKHTAPLINDLLHTSSEDTIVDNIGFGLLQKCHTLKRDQRCVYWFLLRRFTVTTTVASKVLLNDNGIRTELSIFLSHANATSKQQRSTGPMLHGSANQDCVRRGLF